MDIKEILKQSLRDGVNQFIDSTINQLGEEDEPSFEELLEESMNTLSIVMELLTDNGGVSGKFKKSLKDREDIWYTVLTLAIILNGNNVENTEFEGINFESFDELSSRWERAKIFFKCLKDDENNEYHKDLVNQPDLSEECKIYYYNILQLKDWEGGIFSTRKFKKQIISYSVRLFSACEGYDFSIRFSQSSKALLNLLNTDEY